MFVIRTERNRMNKDWERAGFPSKQQYNRACIGQAVNPSLRPHECVKPGDGVQPTYHPGWIYESNGDKRMQREDENPDGTRKRGPVGRPRKERSAEEQFYLSRALHSPLTLNRQGRLTDEALDDALPWYATQDLCFLLRRRTNQTPYELRQNARVWELSQAEWAHNGFLNSARRTGRAFPFWRGDSKKEAMHYLWKVLPMDVSTQRPIPIEYRTIKDASVPERLPSLYVEYHPWWIPGDHRGHSTDMESSAWVKEFGYVAAKAVDPLGVCQVTSKHAKVLDERLDICPGCREASRWRAENTPATT